MIYEYECEGLDCQKNFDVIKRVAEIDNPERCPQCKREARRVFIPRSVYFSGTKVESPEYNPGLGCIVKNSQHRKQIVKDRGLIELGNEKLDTVHSHYDQARAEIRDRRWAEATKGWIGEG